MDMDNVRPLIPDEPEEFRKTVLREELILLTGNNPRALILQNFIYWHSKTRDYEAFLEEEKERLKGDNPAIESIPSRMGWVYKDIETIIKESLCGVKEKSCREHIKHLVKNGWVERRKNPKNPMDKVLQYRCNILKIQADLQKFNAVLEGYKYVFSKADKLAIARKYQNYRLETVITTASKESKLPLRNGNDDRFYNNKENKDYSTKTITKTTGVGCFDFQNSFSFVDNKLIENIEKHYPKFQDIKGVVQYAIDTTRKAEEEERVKTTAERYLKSIIKNCYNQEKFFSEPREEKKESKTDYSTMTDEEYKEHIRQEFPEMKWGVVMNRYMQPGFNQKLSTYRGGFCAPKDRKLFFQLCKKHADDTDFTKKLG